MIISARSMKFVHWVRFHWDLNQLPTLGALPPHYSFTPIPLSDEKELRIVIRRSFVHDTAWSDAMHEVNGMLDCWLQPALDPGKIGLGLALRHGLRMIGAAVLIPDSESENHLSPGPCVLLEYRNRGFGTALLAESLRQLQEAGLSRAVALTKSNAPVAKFLYPKFNGVLTPGDTPLVAA
jgi:ribosomal protein S18 acetylase RimI-like enzyme